MNWYVTRLCFEIVSPGADLFQAEEQIRLILADHEQQAFEKAHHLGCSLEITIPSTSVKWKFLGIRNLYLLPELKDQKEVFVNSVDCDDPERYRKDLSLFNSELKKRMTNPILA